MATSTSSDRLFSTAGLCSCLNRENARAIVYLNKKMDGEHNHSMGSLMDGTPPQSEDR